MPVVFFNKSVAYEPPAGFIKFTPKTRTQKLQYKVELIRELAKIHPSSTPKELETLGEHAEKLLLGNALNIYTAPNNSMNENMGEYVGEEIFAPEGYAESLTAAENTLKAQKKAERAAVKAAVGNITGLVAAMGASAAAPVASAPAINASRLHNIQSAIARQQEYMAQGRALMNEAIPYFRTKNISPELKKKAKNQYNLGKSYVKLSEIALEKYKKNLESLGSLGGKRKTHRRKTHRHKTHRRK